MKRREVPSKGKLTSDSTDQSSSVEKPRISSLKGGTVSTTAEKSPHHDGSPGEFDEGGGLSAGVSFLVLLLVFSLSSAVILLVLSHCPTLDAEDVHAFKIPKNIDDAKAIGRLLDKYRGQNYTWVLSAYLATYIFLQTFAIPGSIFLSILSGFLFPFPLALVLVCVCSSIGASLCYLLFYLVGRRLVLQIFPQRVATWSKKVQHHRHHLLNYMLFLRITPFVPNWFINLSSPVLNVPWLPFFLGTFFGVAPPSVGYIGAGVELYELTSTGDAFSFYSIAIVVVAAFVSLAPVFLRKRLEVQLEGSACAET